MDGMVEENGTTGNPGGDPLAHSPGDNNTSVVVTSLNSSLPKKVQFYCVENNILNQNLVASLKREAFEDFQLGDNEEVLGAFNKKRFADLNQSPQVRMQVQSVIQANQQSVIQTPANIQPVQLQKGNVILVSKPNSVIHTTQGSLQTLQVATRPLNGSYHVVVDPGSDDSLSNEDDSTKKRRDILTRRPSYRKILNDLGGGEIAVGRGESSSECDTNEDSELSSHSIPSHYQTHTVIPAGAIQISSQGETVQGLHTLTMTNATTAGGAIVQYAQGQDGQFFVPVVTQGGGITGGPIIAEDQARKREMRLLKNREAARECRRKKKEYIKCLENRVAVLENQNKALIDELKSLKELYCQQKTE